MSGALWAVLAGVGFGLFQAANRRASRGMDVYLSTFLQLAVAAVVLAGVAVATEDLSLLRTARPQAFLNFALAAFVHFFLGWTFLNASQKRIGAARTSPLTSTVPLFGVVIAALVLREFPGPVALAGIALVVTGVYFVSVENDVTPETDRSDMAPGRPAEPAAQVAGWRGAVFGLGTAICWAISPVFIRGGLAGLPSPLLGLTVGMVICVLVYGVVVLARRGAPGTHMSTEATLFKLIAGSLVGLSTWARWVALDLAPVGVVLAVALVSVPVTILLSPVAVGRHLERVTPRLWAGASVIIGGSLLLVWYR
ncbi:MAG: DMT family transporter [bacterium]